jgi:hypothetical protein
MTTVTGTLRSPAHPVAVQPWLRSRRWDLSVLIFSVFVAAIPYSAYLLFGGSAAEAASDEGTLAYNARLFVNTLVTLLIGGPHMYATFTRTIMDRQFFRKRFWFLASTIIVPIAVITMAVSSYQSYVWLLSIFFAMASLHALYQILWLTDAYNDKAGAALSWPSRLIDYGVVFSSLYPVATYRMVSGEFRIGPVELIYSSIIGGWYWLAYLAFAGFAVMLALFVGKTVMEYRGGYFNLPKTLLIGVTVALMFSTPLFPNLDTAFQGINTWHSFQYLALTWYAVHVLEQRTGQRFGFMHWVAAEGGGARTRGLPGLLAAAWRGLRAVLKRVDRGTGWASFYLVTMALLPISGLILIGARLVWPNLHAGLPGADETYMYIAVLSILLVHYVQDALLFTDPKALTAGNQ